MFLFSNLAKSIMPTKNRTVNLFCCFVSQMINNLWLKILLQMKRLAIKNDVKVQVGLCAQKVASYTY